MGKPKMGRKQIAREKTSRKASSQKATSRTTLNQDTENKQQTNKSAGRILPPHRRRCIIIKDAKHRGEWTELIFMARVTERGFSPSKPWGDSSRYDVAVERQGRFLRVQVKSTIARAYGGYVVAIKSSRCQYYTSRQVDFFAVYIIPEDVWYILPAKIILRLRARFFLAPRRHRQKYAAYKEAWHLLKPGCDAGQKPWPQPRKGRNKLAQDVSPGVSETGRQSAPAGRKRSLEYRRPKRYGVRE